MPDNMTPEQRSTTMARIRSKNTQVELCIRRMLHRKGYRYRLHANWLPGRPDLVFPKYRAVVFIHGCFWHGHTCSLFRWPASNREYWLDKISRNREKDEKNLGTLLREGWRVLTIWECALRGRCRLSLERIARVAERWLHSSRRLKIIEGTRH